MNANAFTVKNNQVMINSIQLAKEFNFAHKKLMAQLDELYFTKTAFVKGNFYPVDNYYLISSAGFQFLSADWDYAIKKNVQHHFDFLQSKILENQVSSAELDHAIAELRRENKKLRFENEQIRHENEQIRQALSEPSSKASPQLNPQFSQELIQELTREDLEYLEHFTQGIFKRIFGE